MYRRTYNCDTCGHTDTSKVRMAQHRSSPCDPKQVALHNEHKATMKAKALRDEINDAHDQAIRLLRDEAYEAQHQVDLTSYYISEREEVTEYSHEIRYTAKTRSGQPLFRSSWTCVKVQRRYKTDWRTSKRTAEPWQIDLASAPTDPADLKVYQELITLALAYVAAHSPKAS